jgi:hypothetical protein
MVPVVCPHVKLGRRSVQKKPTPHQIGWITAQALYLGDQCIVQDEPSVIAPIGSQNDQRLSRARLTVNGPPARQVVTQRVAQRPIFEARSKRDPPF